MSKFKIGDKVRIKRNINKWEQGVIDIMRQYSGEEVTIVNVHENPNVMPYYSVAENVFLWNESTLEPIVPSFRDIKEKKLSCLIRTRTQRDADELYIKLETDSMWSANKCWTSYENDTTYYIKDGKIHAYSDIGWYKTNHPYSELPIYEFGDIVQDGGTIKDWTIVQPFSDDFIPKLKEYYKEYYAKPFNPKTPIKAKKINNKKENDNMNKDAINFTFTKGERTAIVVDTIEHKDSKNKTILEKKTREVKIPTIKTTAYTVNGTASTTCDEKDFHERVGCLVASAKIIASKSKEAYLIYQIATKSWGTDISTIILETLADRAIAGDFNKRYDKWVREEKKLNDDKCKCKTCGKKFDTPDDAREHEEWHVERKRAKRENYLIRKEAKRRLAEKEKENKIEKAIIEIKKEEEKNRNK